MQYCSSCCHANDGGIIGNDPVCSRTQATQWWGHTCESWEQDERSFVERYPEYAHVCEDSSGLSLRLFREKALESGGGVVEVDTGVRAIYPKTEAKQLMLGEL